MYFLSPLFFIFRTTDLKHVYNNPCNHSTRLVLTVLNSFFNSLFKAQGKRRILVEFNSSNLFILK